MNDTPGAVNPALKVWYLLFTGELKDLRPDTDREEAVAFWEVKLYTKNIGFHANKARSKAKKPTRDKEESVLSLATIDWYG